MKDNTVHTGKWNFLELLFALLISFVVLSGFGSVVYSITDNPDTATVELIPQIAVVEFASNVKH